MTADLAFMFLFGILLFLLYWQPTITSPRPGFPSRPGIVHSCSRIETKPNEL